MSGEAIRLAFDIVEGRHDGDQTTYYSAMVVLARALLVAEAKNARIGAVLERFSDTVSRAERAIVEHGHGGQHVSFHGDFAAASPSVVVRLEWWVRALREAVG